MNTDPEAPGYRHIIFRPQQVADLSFVKYFAQTSYGNAGIHWKEDTHGFSMEVVVPVGCEATVYVPLREGKAITEGGRAITPSDEIRFIGDKDGYRIVAVQSGTYLFSSK